MVWNEEGLDLTDPFQVDAYLASTKLEYVFVSTGKSGGIRANQNYPAGLMRDNLLIGCNLIHGAHKYQAKKLLYLASSRCYPRYCSQPMQEDSLLTGLLEPTNEAYAVAKIAGLKLCQAYRQQYGANFICGIPANVLGPGDDFSQEDSHVIPAIIRRMHEAKKQGAKSVTIWGSGSPRREFIFSSDLASACILVMREYNRDQPINSGVGADISIAELANLIKEIVGFKGLILFDSIKLDGMPVKLLNSNKLRALKWVPRTPLSTALEATYQWFIQAVDRG
jgi:GDP-L-fucose synthase